MTHLLGCLWFWASTLALDLGYTDTWLVEMKDHLGEDKINDLYSEAFFWALRALLLDAQEPTNDFELHVTVLALLFGAFVFSYST